MFENNYAPEGKYLWDPWFITVGKDIHMFHLEAKRTGDADGRHNNKVSIGHAVSTDLKNWKRLPLALAPGKETEWDGVSLWTGSTYFDEDSGTYYLFYTGRNKDALWVQRLGVATSKDLITWEKYAQNPILEADNKIYKMNNEKNSLGVVPAFRDPFIYKEKGKYYAIITARDNSLPALYNGCIALAVSTDLKKWKLLPPLLSPGRHDEMEVPQLVVQDGKYHLFFLANPKFVEPKWAAKVGSAHGLHCYMANSLQGEYLPVNNGTGTVYNNPALLGLRLIRKNDNTYDALGWFNEGPDGKLIGRVSDVKKVRIEGDEVRIM